MNDFSVRERILVYLHNETTEATIKQLCNGVHSSKGSVSGRLSEMFNAGEVEKRRTERKGKPLLIRLTARGHAVALTQTWRMGSRRIRYIGNLPRRGRGGQ